jgi:protein TonB
MYDENSSVLSGTRGTALAAVIMLHLLAGYAFYSGLGSVIFRRLDPAPIDLAPPREPPKVPIDTPRAQNTDVLVTPPKLPPWSEPTDPQPPMTTDPVPPAPPTLPQEPTGPKVLVAAHMDPRHPVRIADDAYPDAARRANESGRCTVEVTVSPEGRIVAARVRTSSGFERLDKACAAAVIGQHMTPATENGKPVEGLASFPITWQLTER